ncbi:AraC family transcriptional regulator [Chitinasiproducens palmae]|uniref:AraC-type DNA-binding protein n=1 Tax=Chitinasiproducens palmae TaxID=1770053 RepID=A0A1H2PUD8_9BURK|nr:helix-turn-helix transcriptional regulator [Chitinasiproducens palmae]SDV50786.1 AraC-type DNA-binding protein [Chitinasiproducens palmae]
MPIINKLFPPEQWIDPDAVPRPVVTFGMALERLDSFELDFHRHAKSQLLLTLRGVLSCEIEGGLWLVPPQSAIWIPGGTMHSVTAAGTLEGYNAFIDPAVATGLPGQCCSLTATPLLRELMIRAAHLPMLYTEGGMESNLVTLLLDEMRLAPLGTLHLPMPADARLRALVAGLMANPADRGTMQTWAARSGMSERTLARLIAAQTGMSFGRWRQQLRVMLALQWLAKGLSIQKVADGLGYESAGSFVTMFRKVLGAPPGRYMARRERADREASAP